MNFILFIILSTILTACASTRTLYQPRDENGGYQDRELKDNVIVVRFEGNSETESKHAKLFSQFRAVEVCKEKGFKVARFLSIDNRTSSETVQKTSSYTNTTPTYFSANSNNNSSYNSFGNTLYQTGNTTLNGSAYGGNTYGGSKTWNETYYYPTFDTYFTCHNEIYMAGLELKVLSSEDLKEFVKDRLGGIQVIKIEEDSENLENFSIGDIIIKINNQRVFEVNQMSKQIEIATDKNIISANIVREGKLLSIKFKTKNYIDHFKKANEQIVRIACYAPEVKQRAICSSAAVNSGN